MSEIVVEIDTYEVLVEVPEISVDVVVENPEVTVEVSEVAVDVVVQNHEIVVELVGAPGKEGTIILVARANTLNLGQKSPGGIYPHPQEGGGYSYHPHPYIPPQKPRSERKPDEPKQ